MRLLLGTLLAALALAACGYDEPAPDAQLDSQLIEAAREGDVSAGGVDTTIRDRDGNTALDIAEGRGYEEMVRILRGAS